MELGEFLLFLREEIAKFKRMVCIDLPAKDNYITEVKRLFHIRIARSETSSDLHFRKWLWMLLKADGNQSRWMYLLRIALNKREDNYLWFAKQMELFCDDVHGKSPLEIRNMKKEKYAEYIKFFNAELQNGMLIFLESREKP